MEQLFKCRLAAPGWVNFSGTFGHGAVFSEGVSVNPLTARQIARIGSSTILVNDETGDQVGPSVIHNFLQDQTMTVTPEMKTAEQESVEFEFDRDKLAEDEAARIEIEAAALKAAQDKAQKQMDEAVVYTRAELEAIGANDGIGGLREIAKPLNVRGRAISEMVEEILAAQTKLAVS